MNLRTFCLLLGLSLSSGAATAQASDPGTLLERANAGDAAAQADLAVIYNDGVIVTQNFARAAEWAALAAEAGHAKAQNLLGRYLHTGLGGNRDQQQAVHWLGLAAETGDPDYLNDLANALENGADGSSDPAAAAKFYEMAAKAGHAEAAISLGVLYQEGRGVEQDHAKAKALYEGPAAEGHARAQNNLGLLYVRGQGAPQDYERAVQLFQASAAQGFSKAMRNLGVMYENGFGVPFDEERAVELYRQAGMREAGPALIYDPRLAPPPSDQAALNDLQVMARAGDPVAQFQVAWLLASDVDAPFENKAAAAGLFQDAAKAGHGPSMINLGLMYFHGVGVPLDFVLGQMWVTLAAAAGQKDATTTSMEFASRMTAEQVGQAQRMAEEHAKESR
jgi:TPR repeat protein